MYDAIVPASPVTDLTCAPGTIDPAPHPDRYAKLMGSKTWCIRKTGMEVVEHASDCSMVVKKHVFLGTGRLASSVVPPTST